MEKNIEILRNHATALSMNRSNLDNFCEVSLSAKEAMRIAEILERASYPPIVRAALALLEFCFLDASSNWVSVGVTGLFREHIEKPEFLKGAWQNKVGSHLQHLFEIPVTGIKTKDASTLLFHRTATGWEWVGNPNNQNPEKP